MHRSALSLAQEISTDPQVVEILALLEEDKNQMGADVIYLPGLSHGMVAAGKLFEYIAGRHLSREIPLVAISGSDGEGMDERSKPGDAWPGKAWYLEELGKLGVKSDNIVPLEGPQRHSRQETDALVDSAVKYGWNKVIMVSVDYHRPRQILGAVKYMNETGTATRLFLPSVPFDWDAEMMGSQGRAPSTGRGEALTEWNVKIAKYQAGGQLASLEELDEYLAWRNK